MLLSGRSSCKACGQSTGLHSWRVLHLPICSTRLKCRVQQASCCAPQVTRCLQTCTAAKARLADTAPAFVTRAKQVCIASAVVVLALVGSPANADDKEELTIQFMASRVPEIRAVQTTLVEAWGWASTQFIDPTFNGLDWKQELQTALNNTYKAPDAASAYKVVDGLLAKLGDPYTRLLPPQQASAFKDTTEGQVVTLGLLPGVDPDGVLRVKFVAEGSPADKAGITPGDEVVTVNGLPAESFSKEDLSVALKVEADVTLRHGKLFGELRGEEGKKKKEKEGEEEFTVHLAPEAVEVHPIQFAALPRAGSTNYGYIRIATFSANAPDDFRDALRALQREEVGGYILDLRDNYGGVVGAGYGIAQQLLGEGEVFCNAADRTGATEEVFVEDAEPGFSQPLVVLVNGGTASTSELLAGALHDDGRARLVGEHTFGKGRTQRPLELSDGSTLLLSNTLYRTPNDDVIDKVGLEPDIVCKPEGTDAEFWRGGRREAGGLEQDPCVRRAQKVLDELAAERAEGAKK